MDFQRLFYINHEFENRTFDWVRLIFFFSVSSISFDCRTQSNSIHELISIEFDWVRLKFSLTGFDSNLLCRVYRLSAVWWLLCAYIFFLTFSSKEGMVTNSLKTLISHWAWSTTVSRCLTITPRSWKKSNIVATSSPSLMKQTLWIIPWSCSKVRQYIFLSVKAWITFSKLNHLKTEYKYKRWKN